MPPKKFKTIKQPDGSKVCGAAVCAMATGRTLHEAIWRMRCAIDPQGMAWFRTRDVLEYLGAHGILFGQWLGSEEPGKPFRIESAEEKCTYRLSLKGVPAILVVKSRRFDGASHFVFWDGENIRDPCPRMATTTAIGEYDIEEIWPLTYIDESREKWKKPNKEPTP